MKFKIDENLPVEVAELLRNFGHKAVTAVEQDLGGSADLELAEICKHEGRVIITLDVDFADLRVYPPSEYPGLVVLRLRRQDKMHVLNVIKRVLTAFGREPLAGHLWIVEEDRIRIRS
jgi:predicted nuclease of predicted toxin-antitoxin system